MDPVVLFLSALLEKHYRLPDRLAVIVEIRKKDSINFSDAMLSLIKDKHDGEFYSTLLKHYKAIHGVVEYYALLIRLKVPLYLAFKS